MKTLILIILGTIPTVLYSQSAYFLGYDWGYKQGCQCISNPNPPVEMYAPGSYDQGYADGFAKGYPVRRGINPNAAQPNVRQNNLVHKQQLLNDRLFLLDGMINDITKLYLVKSQKYQPVPKEMSDYMGDVLNTLMEHKKFDLTDGLVWNTLQKYYAKHKNNVNSW